MKQVAHYLTKNLLINLSPRYGSEQNNTQLRFKHSYLGKKYLFEKKSSWPWIIVLSFLRTKIKLNEWKKDIAFSYYLFTKLYLVWNSGLVLLVTLYCFLVVTHLSAEQSHFIELSCFNNRFLLSSIKSRANIVY